MSDKLKELPDNFRELRLSQRLDWISENWNVTRQMAEEVVSRYDKESNYLQAKYAEKDRLKALYKNEWCMAEHCMEVWGMSEETFRSRVLPELPVYESPEKTSDPINARIPVEPHSRGFWGDPPDDLSSPSNWWVRRLDAAFFEKIHPELCPSPRTNPWVTPFSILLGHKYEPVTDKELLKLVRNDELSLYRLDPKVGVVIASWEHVNQYGAKGCLFWAAQLDNFVAKNPNIRKKSGRWARLYDDMKKAINHAEELRDQNPEITAEDLAARTHKDLKTKFFDPWAESTVYKHISNALFPERKKTRGGRPGKHKK